MSEGSPNVRRVTVDDRNTHSFRVPHRASSSSRTPQRTDGPTQYQLMTRLKSVISDVVVYLQNHPTEDAVFDNFIAVSEDSGRAFRQLRIDSRSRPRRTNTIGDISVDSVDVEGSPARRKGHVDPTSRDPKESAWVKPLPLSRTDTSRDAQRTSERHAEADARRKLLAAERQQRLESQADRVADVRARRDAAGQRIRDESLHRMERAQSHRAREVEERKEFAVKDVAKIDEAHLVRASEAENRAIEIDEKHRAIAKNSEHLALERQQAAKDRADARHVVVSRAKSAEKQRHEAQLTKVHAKDEQTVRHQAERRKESEERSQRVEQRRERVQEQQQRDQAEAEAKLSKTVERIEKSEKHREELVSKLREKSEKQEQKIKEARERRDQPPKQTKVSLVMLPHTEAALASKEEVIQKCAALSARHAKPFLEETQLNPASAKSKLRSIMARFASAQSNSGQFRQPLHELHLAIDSASASEVGALRCTVGIPVIVDVLGRSKDFASRKVLAEVLVKFVNHAADRTKNVEFFVRGGCLGKLVEVLHDEMKKVAKQASSAVLSCCLSLFYTCTDFVLFHSRGAAPELQIFRHIIFEAFNALDVLDYTLSLATVAVSDDINALQAGIACVRSVYAAAKPKSFSMAASESELHDRLAHSLITCVANMLMPGGQPLRPETSLTPAATGVLFLCIRLLNDIARRDLKFLQGQVADPAMSTVFAHVVTSICSFVAAHEAELENIPPMDLTPKQVGKSATFGIANGAGINFDRFPVIEIAGKKPQFYIRAAFHELLLLAGYVSINNAAVQDFFSYGRDTPLLCQLIAALPVAYFGVSQHVAFPSLLAICFRHQHNLRILQGEMDANAILTFVEKEIVSFGVDTSIPPTRRVEIAPISWADMMDDDEDINEMFANVGKVDHATDDHVARAVGTKDAVPYVCFFRFDRRFAPELWVEAAAELRSTP